MAESDTAGAPGPGDVDAAPAQTPAQSAPPGGRVAPAEVRASDRERDEVVSQLQIAFADGRIDAEEFDARVRGVLGSRTRGELVAFTADLPGALGGAPGASVVPASASASPVPSVAPGGRLSLAYKTSLRRVGRWRVPGVFTAVSYKGGGTVLDLRSAEFTSAHTTIRAVAYKCRVTIYVAPGTRVELSGIGVSDTSGMGEEAGPSGSADLAFDAAAGGPVVRVRGLAYKGVVEIRTAPPGAPAAPGRGAELLR